MYTRIPKCIYLNTFVEIISLPPCFLLSLTFPLSFVSPSSFYPLANFPDYRFFSLALPTPPSFFSFFLSFFFFLFSHLFLPSLICVKLPLPNIFFWFLFHFIFLLVYPL
ncbi:hypothetical protein, unlikely [Trypanosoma brucei gambiense DAL972]|uniref:Uncharacterized protein n=1 Tax=Trypanosoma brucei gambiense (strain MHOM/CI/86/DAL972) TaxID=679716 RepID=D0A5H8_TRYB9|nr:hypothetical protein, unlikely [Trypanosoma brucei gambiense DAL972]CBH16929.1 hypothetical protein, unlikely [Trypanosoma brucei gambiense DAL972]|eukprot:XP_011779193.1 hypothetical protein, unlikely [Trypanosoma brucei gambiense DAL972]